MNRRKRPSHQCSQCWTVHNEATNLCAACNAPTEAARAAAKAVRYGSAHKRLRASYAQVLSVNPFPCARCSLPIAPGDIWHLDHLPNGKSAPSHSACNQAAVYQDGNR